MSEHEVSRVVQAESSAVFAVVSDVDRLPEWLPTVEQSRTLPDGEVHVEGDAGSGDYASEGFWRPSEEQRRVEWSTPSRDGEPGAYAGWLQVEDRTSGCEVVVHLSFLTGEGPAGVEQGLAAALDALADLVEQPPA